MSSNQLQLTQAIENERLKFQKCYLWLENSMPPSFFEEISHDNLMLVTHSLMGFDLQDYFSTINLKRAAIVLCLDSADADLRILERYGDYGIKNYITFVSKNPPPFSGITSNLRIGIIYFTEAKETVDKPISLESKEELKKLLIERNPCIHDEEFEKLLQEINISFLRTLSLERMVLALDMFYRAKTRDSCQYEIRYEEKWKETGKPSLQIVLAWKNTPKYNFLYRLAFVIHRNKLVMKRVNATYINPYSSGSILIMTLALHGANGEAAWDASNIPDFLREFATVKYFATFDLIEEKLVSRNVIKGVIGNYLRSLVSFIHQCLVHIDSNLYTLENIEEAFIRHPDLTHLLAKAVHYKFHPEENDFKAYETTRQEFNSQVSRLDTGNEELDTRRRNILYTGMVLLDFCLKTNLYQQNYTSISMRMDPHYLDHLPFDRTKKFPVLPYGIFFIKGMHFFGFHIRFKDLARGGLRTVFPERSEHIATDRNQIFTECYNLALTQQNKNKDIPEGGAKGIIFLKPDNQIASEIEILKRELNLRAEESETVLENFKREQKTEYLYQSQRSFIESLLTLVNCELDGKLKAKRVVDYWKKPEYLYLGPDENMHDTIIKWIAETSLKVGYKPGSAFISSKPSAGINHKEYGVTSLGLNVFVEELLMYAGINPYTTSFTVKMSGGPDGDVAGNQLLNFYRNFPSTAKIIALTDVSGTIYDPDGLDKKILADLFHARKSIRFYPADKLHNKGFLLDLESRRHDTALSVQTELKEMKEGRLHSSWLNGSDMNAVYRSNVHSVKADIFIPAGGRPRTLNEHNYKEFLDKTGVPTAKLIVEGANLYISPSAREKLEDLGCLIIKDSSANKTGVICSSFEVQCGLAIGDEIFIEYKEILVKEILERLKEFARMEARLLLRTHHESGQRLTHISTKISERINQFSDQIMDYLQTVKLSHDPKNPLIACFLSYCLNTLKEKFQKELLIEIPDPHKKAIIAAHLAATLVYNKGLTWFPTIVDILPSALKEVALDNKEC